MSAAAERRAHDLGLLRRKADMVKGRGMAVSVEGKQLRAAFDEIDDLRERLESVDSSVMAERHEVELARVCADHKDEMATAADAHLNGLAAKDRDHVAAMADLTNELTAARAERDEARRALATVPAAPKLTPAENGAKGGRPPKGKVAALEGAIVAADSILREELDLWGSPLLDALAAWGDDKGRGDEVAAWVKTLAPLLPAVVPAES